MKSLGGPPRRREGAGRRKGSRNRRTREVLEALAAPNCTPLVYMLRIMNDPAAEPKRRDQMALAAAPFLHSRLTPNAWLPTRDEDEDDHDHGASLMVDRLLK